MSVTLEYTPELVQNLADSSNARQEWKERALELARKDIDHQFEIGELIAEGFDRWGEHKVYEMAVEIFPKYTKATLKDFVYVFHNVKKSLRNDLVSWAHHKAVAQFAKTPELQKELLAYAAKKGPEGKGLPLAKFRSYIDKHPDKKKRPNDKPTTVKFTSELSVETMKALHDLGGDLAVETKEAHRRLVEWALKVPNVAQEIKEAGKVPMEKAA